MKSRQLSDFLSEKIWRYGFFRAIFAPRKREALEILYEDFAPCLPKLLYILQFTYIMNITRFAFPAILACVSLTATAQNNMTPEFIDPAPGANTIISRISDNGK